MERKLNYTRQELYNLVWAHPVPKLAKVYGLSDRGFAKLCDRNSVPTPPRGYWAMSPAAKRGLKPPLLLESGVGQNVRMPVPATLSSAASAGESRYRRLYDELVGSLPPVHVPKALKNPHREIRKILDQDALRQLEPALAPIFQSALYYPEQAQTKNPGRLVASLAQAVLRRGGRLVQAEVTDIEIGPDGPVALQTTAGRHPVELLVLCAGAWSGRLAKGNTAQQWVKLEMLSGSGSFLLDGFGSFAACFFVGLHEIDVTYAQCRGEFKQGNHSWIAAPALEIADVLLGKARCIRELFLREALLLPQPPEISADQLAHVHSRKLRLYIL